MQSYPVDLDPEQIVQWVMAERRAPPLVFTAIARRTTEPRDLPARREIRLGDQEREDLSEIATIATLEISPIHAGDGWRLTVVVEDEAGPRVPKRALWMKAKKRSTWTRSTASSFALDAEARMSLPRSRIPPPNDGWRSCSARSRETATALIANDTRTGAR